VKSYLKDQEALLSSLLTKLKPGNKHVMRVKKRIELLNAEIAEFENPQPDD
jgi:hypothetical protein